MEEDSDFVSLDYMRSDEEPELRRMAITMGSANSLNFPSFV